jgi:hypothetical protein
MKWIPVTERLPPFKETVLVYCDYKVMTPAFVFQNKRWLAKWNHTEILGVTHWMPLPKPPKTTES